MSEVRAAVSSAAAAGVPKCRSQAKLDHVACDDFIDRDV
jgi:hypothetical protein